jgi:hypothetical protein
MLNLQQSILLRHCQDVHAPVLICGFLESLPAVLRSLSMVACPSETAMSLL